MLVIDKKGVIILQYYALNISYYGVAAFFSLTVGVNIVADTKELRIFVTSRL